MRWKLLLWNSGKYNPTASVACGTSCKCKYSNKPQLYLTLLLQELDDTSDVKYSMSEKGYRQLKVGTAISQMILLDSDTYPVESSSKTMSAAITIFNMATDIQSNHLVSPKTGYTILQ